MPVAVERLAIAVADSVMTFYIAREASKVLTDLSLFGSAILLAFLRFLFDLAIVHFLLS